MAPPLSHRTIKVNKMDAAKRQFRSAILLWFIDEDPVSIHTLVSAAHEIVHTLYRRKGLKDLFFDSSRIKEERRKEFAIQAKAAATFFKHAQKDPDGEIDFRPDVNPVLLVFIATGLQRMNEPLGDLEEAFLAWFGIHYPEMLTVDVYSENLPVDELEHVRSLSKREFLEFHLGRRV